MAETNQVPPAEHKEQPKAEKKEEKKIGTLESVVNESLQLVGSTAKIGTGAALTYAFANYVWPIFKRDTYILSGAQVASDMTTSYKRGKKYTAGSFLESTVLGIGTTPVIEGMFRITNLVPTNSLAGYVAKGAVWGGIMYPAFVASYQPIAYLIRNRTFKGLGKYLKENYWTSLKQAWTKLLPLSLLNIFFAPTWLQIPVSAGLSYLFDLFGAPQKGDIPEEQKRDKTPYLAAASSAVGKGLRTIFYGIPEAVYSVGSSIRDLYKKAPAPAPVPPPAPAPAH